MRPLPQRMPRLPLPFTTCISACLGVTVMRGQAVSIGCLPGLFTVALFGVSCAYSSTRRETCDMVRASPIGHMSSASRRASMREASFIGTPAA
jgi:hypothetical protein